jgi:hypothetical protein
MISFILAIGLGQAVAGADCPGGVCSASSSSSVGSSCSSGSCSASSSGKLFRRGRSSGGSVAMVPSSPVVTKEENKTAEAPKAVESMDSSSSRRKGLLSFRR